MSTTAVTIVSFNNREKAEVLIRFFNNGDGYPGFQVPRLQAIVGRRKVFFEDRWFSSEQDKRQFYENFFNGPGDLAAEVFVGCRVWFAIGERLTELARRADSYILSTRQPAYYPEGQGPDFIYELSPNSDGAVRLRITELWVEGKPQTVIYDGLLANCKPKDRIKFKAEEFLRKEGK